MLGPNNVVHIDRTTIELVVQLKNSHGHLTLKLVFISKRHYGVISQRLYLIKVVKLGFECGCNFLGLLLIFLFIFNIFGVVCIKLAHEVGKVLLALRHGNALESRFLFHLFRRSQGILELQLGRLYG